MQRKVGIKTVKITRKRFGVKVTFYAVLAALAVFLMLPSASFAQDSWQGDIDWAASNSDAGGSVDCPADYASNEVWYAVVSGGRAAVINEALFAAYKQDFDRSYNLVLLTQCHNPDAAQRLLNAGQRDVLTYLVRNYQPTGVDPEQVIGAAQTVLSILLASE
jgi:hypothetical protein